MNTRASVFSANKWLEFKKTKLDGLAFGLLNHIYVKLFRRLIIELA